MDDVYNSLRKNARNPTLTANQSSLMLIGNTEMNNSASSSSGNCTSEDDPYQLTDPLDYSFDADQDLKMGRFKSTFAKERKNRFRNLSIEKPCLTSFTQMSDPPENAPREESELRGGNSALGQIPQEKVDIIKRSMNHKNMSAVKI